MYLRFIGDEIDTRTGQPVGLMSMAYALLREDACIGEATQLQAHVGWIETTVPVPTRFSRTRNAYHKNTHGIAWARADAREFVRHLYAIADILDRHDRAVRTVRSARPGFIVYQDDWQVVAEPFHGEAR